MFRYAMLCCAMLCYAMRYAMLCCEAFAATLREELRVAQAEKREADVVAARRRLEEHEVPY